MSSGGPKMAGTDQLDVLFKGVGGHGSTPQLTRDPVLMAAYAVVQYQAIVSRVIDPQQTGVLTVGSIQAGVDNNVIPQTALVKANLRCANRCWSASSRSAMASRVPTACPRTRCPSSP
jgi:hippurate hydrolase